MDAMTITKASELQTGVLILTSNRFGSPVLRNVMGLVDGPDDNSVCVKVQSEGPRPGTLTYDKNDIVCVAFDPEDPVVVAVRPAGMYAFEATDSRGRVFRRGVRGRLVGCTVKKGIVEIRVAYGGEDINPPSYGTETWTRKDLAAPLHNWEWDLLADGSYTGSDFD